MTIEKDIELVRPWIMSSHSVHEEAKQAFSRLVEMLPRWRDISTAPRDGKTILVYFKRHG